MTHASFQCRVASDFENLWAVLKDEIENPQAYNPGIKGVEILERFNGGVLRSVAVPDADVREKVLFDYTKREIVSNLVGHPQLVGVIRKTLKDAGAKLDQEQILECTIEWESVDQRVDNMIRRNIEGFIMNGLNHVKTRAESLAKKSR